MTNRRRAAWLLAVLAVTGVTACGDGDDDAENTTDVPSDDAAQTPVDDAETPVDDAENTTDEATSAPDAACPVAPFEFELQLANEFAGEPTVPLAPIVFTDALALQVDESGGAFTIYLADYDLDPADFEGFFDEPTPAADETIVVTYITSFNATEPLEPLAAGDVIEGVAALDTLTFQVIGQRGDALYNSGSPTGTIEILAVDDAYLCATIDYVDLVDQNDPESAEQKIVRGSFTAPVIEWHATG